MSQSYFPSLNGMAPTLLMDAGFTEFGLVASTQSAAYFNPNNTSQCGRLGRVTVPLGRPGRNVLLVPPSTGYTAAVNNIDGNADVLAASHGLDFFIRPQQERGICAMAALPSDEDGTMTWRDDQNTRVTAWLPLTYSPPPDGSSALLAWAISLEGELPAFSTVRADLAYGLPSPTYTVERTSPLVKSHLTLTRALLDMFAQVRHTSQAAVFVDDSITDIAVQLQGESSGNEFSTVWPGETAAGAQAVRLDASVPLLAWVATLPSTHNAAQWPQALTAAAAARPDYHTFTSTGYARLDTLKTEVFVGLSIHKAHNLSDNKDHKTLDLVNTRISIAAEVFVHETGLKRSLWTPGGY